MKILISVFFNAPRGGLQDNILSTALHCRQKGHEVTVLLKPGPFDEQLRSQGIETINTDYADPEETAAWMLREGHTGFDVIHTHPFLSRKVALQLSKETKTPALITYHGMYGDQIAACIDDYAVVLAVSEGVKDNLCKAIPHHRHKIFIAPNGVDRQLFRPRTNDAESSESPSGPDKLRIGLVTRLDQDKRFIIDIFYKALQYTIRHHPNRVTWSLVGDGTLREEVLQTANTMNVGGETAIELKGWLEGTALRDAYQECDVVIAPGRCALESMACAKPTIAIGSKVYVGLITHDNWMKGAYTNFGGVGAKMDDYVEGSIEKDLAAVLDSTQRRTSLGRLGRTLVESFYDEKAINDRILGYYELCASRPAETVEVAS